MTSQPFRLERRSVPEQLRYLAGKLRAADGMGVTAVSASLLLDALADELEAAPQEAALAERERIRDGIRDLMQRRPPLVYFGRDLDEVLDGPP